MSLDSILANFGFLPSEESLTVPSFLRQRHQYEDFPLCEEGVMSMPLGTSEANAKVSWNLLLLIFALLFNIENEFPKIIE